MDTQTLTCKVCGHSWKTTTDPKRCSNPKCRSFIWKDGKEAPKPAAIYGVRVDDDRKGQFERAARAAGKSVPDWLRDLGIAAISPPPQTSDSINRRFNEAHSEFRQSAVDQRAAIAAIEHAARAEAPIGRSVTEFLLSKQPTIKVETGVSLSTGDLSAIAPASSNEVVKQPKAPSRPWLPELLTIQAKYEIRAEDGIDEYAERLRESGSAPPSEYRTFQPGDRRMLSKRAEILDQKCPLPAPDGW